jgi:hypothetical protein
MKTPFEYIPKISAALSFLLLLFVPEIIEAQTAAGVGHMHRATRRRTAVVVSSATHAQDQQQAQAQAAAQTPPPQQATPAPAPASTPPPASTQAQLPIGTVVTKLPAGCVSKPINGMQYYQCGSNYYLAAYQEGALVYVTAAPPS